MGGPRKTGGWQPYILRTIADIAHRRHVIRILESNKTRINSAEITKAIECVFVGNKLVL